MNRIETTALKMHGDKTMSIRSFLTSAARAAVKAGVIISKQATNIADNRDQVVSAMKELSDATHGIKTVAIDVVCLGVEVARHIDAELKIAASIVTEIDARGNSAMDKLMSIINKGISDEEGGGQGGVGGGQGEGAGGGQGEGAGEGQGGGDVGGDVEKEWGYVGGIQDVGEGQGEGVGLTWDQNPRLREVCRMAEGLRGDMQEFAEVHEFELVVVPTVGGIVKAAGYVAFKLRQEGYKAAADRIRDRAKYIETYSEGLYNDHKL